MSLLFITSITSIWAKLREAFSRRKRNTWTATSVNSQISGIGKHEVPPGNTVAELEAQIAALKQRLVMAQSEKIDAIASVRLDAEAAVRKHYEEVRNKRGPKAKAQERFSLRLNTDYAIIIADIAKNEGTSINDLLNHYIGDGIKRDYPEYFKTMTP